MRSVGRLLQRLRAMLHSLCGWVWFKFGFRLRARPHYERVLQLRGCDFGAYVQLGRIAFAIGDYAGWRREFEHARRTDPHRFARLRHPFELFEPRLAGTNFEEASNADSGFSGAGERATWRSLLFGPTHKHPAGLRTEKMGSENGLDAGGKPSTSPDAGAFDAGLEALLGGGDGLLGGGAAANRAPHPHGDDCESAAERRRFRELGPIRSLDLGKCDLDDLARKLSG